jgi:endonuclease/exonuclease/phosphatase family metal-dependent hydrolase
MIRVMSFNIRCANYDDGENSWENRKSLVLARIRAFQPDLLGIQECRDDAQAGFLKSNLKEYQFYGVQRGGAGDTALEMAPILFLKASFQIIQSGHFWLSETPEILGSKSWDSVFARTATWVQLLHRNSGRTLFFLNTHFDYQPIAINGATRLLRQWVERTVLQYPLILTGDFNADKNSSAYQCLTADHLLFDVHRQVLSSGEDEPTFHGFGQKTELSPIDWILASKNFEVVTTSVDTFHEGNRYPSDHYPILAVLKLEGKS